MTHRRKRSSPRPEEAATMQLHGTLPGTIREVQLANGSIADLAGPFMIAEVEPVRRWQHGAAQLLEYWDQSLHSAHPVLIILRDREPANRAQDKRLERFCDAYGLRLWTWQITRQRWTDGGPGSMPCRPPTGRLVRPDGGPYTACPHAIKAYRKRHAPYDGWLRTYLQRVTA